MRNRLLSALMLLNTQADAGSGGAASNPPPAPDAKPDAGAAAAGGSADKKPAAEAAKPAAAAAAAPAKKAGLLAGTDDAPPPADGKPAEGADKKDGQPPAADAPFEVKLPDGVQVDKAVLDKFIPLAKEAGLTPENASKLAAFYTEVQAEQAKAVEAAWEKQDAAWTEALQADKDFGGAGFKQNVAHARKALLHFGGPELAAELNHYGFASHPGLLKAFSAIGKAMGEDSANLKTSARGSTGPRSTSERAQAFYTDMK